MQTSVATLLLLTASVILACVVIDYAVSISQATLQTTNVPQLQHLKDIENSVLNQTSNLYSQTTPPVQENQATPTPPDTAQP